MSKSTCILINHNFEFETIEELSDCFLRQFGESIFITTLDTDFEYHPPMPEPRPPWSYTKISEDDECEEEDRIFSLYSTYYKKSIEIGRSYLDISCCLNLLDMWHILPDYFYLATDDIIYDTEYKNRLQQEREKIYTIMQRFESKECLFFQIDKHYNLYCRILDEGFGDLKKTFADFQLFDFADIKKNGLPQIIDSDNLVIYDSFI